MFVKDARVEKGASTLSARAAGIPGLVRGLVAVHRAHGRLPLKLVMAPAISLAQDGFTVSTRFHEQVQMGQVDFNPAARAVFLTPEGSAPAVGSRFRQEDLAWTLKAISRTDGEAFYTGEVARRLVAAVNDEGGIWSLADLAGYTVKKRAPVRGTYRGYDVVSMGPPSSGGLLLVQMLAVFERLSVLPYGSAAYFHRMVEITKRAFAMRAKGLGDPDYFQVDREAFVGPETVTRVLGEVRAAKDATAAADIGELVVRPEERTDTSHLGVLMANGDAVACTQTVNLRFGSGRVAKGTGVILNNEMDDFSAMPGAPNAFGLVGDVANAIAPGKRPLSSMTPTILLKNGEAHGVFGSPGGSTIITTTLQSILNVVDHGMDAGEAVGRGRIHHQWYPDVVMTEPRALNDDISAQLKTRGHVVGDTPMHRRSMGNAMILWRRPDTVLTGAADPRGEGTAGGHRAP